MRKQLYKLLSIGGLILLTSQVVQAQTCASPATSNSPLCVGSSLNLSAPSGGSSYSWTGPNGFSSTQQNPVVSKVQVTANGIYTVKRTLFIATCTATVSVVINAKPVVSALSNSPVCAGASIGLSATGGTSYTWAGPSAFSSTLQNPTRTNATTTMAGVYTVTAQNGSNCTSTATINVVVNTSPVASALSNSPVCAGASIGLSATGGDNYSWAGPSGFSSTLSNPTRTNADTMMEGVYTVIVTSTNICTTTATTSIAIVTCAGGRLAINDAGTDFLDLKTYPNPANNELSVEIHNPEKLPIRLQLLDSQGQRKGEWQLPSDATTTKTIDIRHLPPMMYIISAENEKRKVMKKVLKLGNK
ncbi:MAG: T9SS type A sorting domain-containing protein [Spirosomataceae bacterium]